MQRMWNYGVLRFARPTTLSKLHTNGAMAEEEPKNKFTKETKTPTLFNRENTVDEYLKYKGKRLLFLLLTVQP